VNCRDGGDAQPPRGTSVYDIRPVAVRMHDAGPQSAAQLEDRRTLLPVRSTGEDYRVRDNSCGGQAPEQRVILLTAVKHRSNVHVVPGVRLSLRKRLHDALQASDFPGSHDMENQHDKAL